MPFTGGGKRTRVKSTTIGSAEHAAKGEFVQMCRMEPFLIFGNKVASDEVTHVYEVQVELLDDCYQGIWKDVAESIPDIVQTFKQPGEWVSGLPGKDSRSPVLDTSPSAMP